MSSPPSPSSSTPVVDDPKNTSSSSSGGGSVAVGESVIRTMTRLAAEHQAVNLSQGFPNEPPPLEVRVALARAVLEGVVPSSSSASVPSLTSCTTCSDDDSDEKKKGGGEDDTTGRGTTSGLDALLATCLELQQQSKNGNSSTTNNNQDSDELNQYSPPMGRLDVRHAIADYYQRLYQWQDLATRADACVTVTLGATEAIASALRTLGQPGDKVAFFEPFHELYPSQCRIFYLEPIYVTLREQEQQQQQQESPEEKDSGANGRTTTCSASSWTFDEAELEAALEQAKILILNTPHNPTGKVFSRTELQTIARLCHKHNVYVITDEIYEHMTYYPEKRHLLLPTLCPDLADRILICNSVGKSASATGWRLGWCVHPPHLSGTYRGIHDQLVVMSPHPMQYAALTYLQHLPDTYFTETLASRYLERLQLLAQTLRQVGFDVSSSSSYSSSDQQQQQQQQEQQPPVEGAYYLFCRYRRVPALRDLEPGPAALYLLQRAGVAAVPGDNFYGSKRAANKQARDYLRFAACRSLSDVQQACERLKAALLLDNDT